MEIDGLLATLVVIAMVIIGYGDSVKNKAVEETVIKPDMKFERDLNKIFRYDNIKTTPLFDDNIVNEVVEE